jgi:penicillin-binding protein 1A
LGIVSPLHDNASLALGTDEVTPLELTAAYGAFANGGGRVAPHLVSSFGGADGKNIFQRRETPSPAVMTDQVRRDMTAMLGNVIQAGTGTAARLSGREAAGKTGTTQDYRDAWFVGFTAQHVAGVWIGNDDNRPMRKVTGGTVPAQIWKAMMQAAEAQTPVLALDRSAPPANIESVQVTAPTYLDDPMQGSTIDSAAYRLPEIASAEPVPSVSAMVTAPAAPLSGPVIAPAPAPFFTPSPVISSSIAEPPPPNPVAQNNPRPSGQPDARPMSDQPYSPLAPEPPQREPEYRNTPEADPLYRQREAEYRRVLRQATAPNSEEDTPPPRRRSDRLPAEESYRGLPFP